MADCYDVDVERSDEPCASTSNLPFGMGAYGKPHGPPNPVAMFYPQLSGYEIRPLIINQHRRAAHEKLQTESGATDSDSTALRLVTTPMHKELIRQNFKQKQRSPKRRVPNTDPGDLSTASGNSFPQSVAGAETEASDYSAKSRKSFFCRACGKAFKFQTSLLRHNNKVHISKYQCPTCSRVFSRQAYLDVHTSKQGSSCYLGTGFANTSVVSSPKSDLSSNMPNIK
jgi:uncharacterized C2H2 Zn-finger protein